MSGEWAHFEDAALSQGFTQIPNVVMRNGRLSMQAKYLYGLLLSYAWQDKQTHPGVKRLCNDAGVGKDTLGKYMHELIDAELIDVRRRGRGMTNLYIFKALTRPLDGDTGSHQESDTGSALDGDTGSHNEYAVNENTSNEDSVVVDAQEKLPDDTTARCLQLLLQVKGFPRDQGENAIRLAQYRELFPSVDAVEVCEDFKAFIAETPFRSKDKPRLRLRNFFKQAAKRTEPVRLTAQSGDANAYGVTQQERDQQTKTMKDGYEWLFKEKELTEPFDKEAMLRRMRGDQREPESVGAA